MRAPVALFLALLTLAPLAAADPVPPEARDAVREGAFLALDHIEECHAFPACDALRGDPLRHTAVPFCGPAPAPQRNLPLFVVWTAANATNEQVESVTTAKPVSNTPLAGENVCRNHVGTARAVVHWTV